MNILILTSIYPQEDDEKNIGVTPVVKYFANEWAKAGHNVMVVHNSSRYPNVLFLIPEFWLKKANSKFGIVVPNWNQRKKLYNKSEGVISFRLPMLKMIPKSKYTDFQIKKQFKKILKILKAQSFRPDIIIGHWENPQIPLLSLLKKEFNSKTALVFHGIVYIKQDRYRKFIKKYLDDIDVFGGRSEAIATEAKELLSLEEDPFICYSGIPDIYFDNKKYKEVVFEEKSPNSYLYVGRLIKRKNVDVSILVLKKMYDENNFTLNIVGEGAEKEHLKSLTRELCINKNINFLGYKKRDEIIDLMALTEVFIMISDNETFGLVYIEAMSRGCIVVASRSGGMDGIINHGTNGFLCEQGNEHELYSICRKINEMTIKEKTMISINARKTALNFKDSKVAQKYLESVIK